MVVYCWPFSATITSTGPASTCGGETKDPLWVAEGIECGGGDRREGGRPHRHRRLAGDLVRPAGLDPCVGGGQSVFSVLPCPSPAVYSTLLEEDKVCSVSCPVHPSPAVY